MEEEGWETVQRGRLRARVSPCQKSTENLAPANQGAKRNLMRSLSVPDNSNTKTPTEKQSSSGEPKTLRAVSERHLPGSELSTRERTHSKDSEKENIPTIKDESDAERMPVTPTESSTPTSSLPKSISSSPSKPVEALPDLSLDKVSKTALELDLTASNAFLVVVVSGIRENVKLFHNDA